MKKTKEEDVLEDEKVVVEDGVAPIVAEELVQAVLERPELLDNMETLNGVIRGDKQELPANKIAVNVARVKENIAAAKAQREASGVVETAKVKADRIAAEEKAMEDAEAGLDLPVVDSNGVVEHPAIAEQHRIMVEKAAANQKLANQGKHFGQ